MAEAERITISTRGATTEQPEPGPAASLGEPDVRILPDEVAVAVAAAELVLTNLREGVAERGRADLLLTGGSSAVNLYRVLAEAGQDAVDWGKVHLWWGDERFVPYDHPQSNSRLGVTMLLRSNAHGGESGEGDTGTDAEAGRIAGVRVPVEQVHPIPVGDAIRDGRGAEVAAAGYAALLAAQGPPAVAGIPVFDVVLLGLGGDGHILSVFPDSPALAPDAPLVMAIPAPGHIEPHLERVTLNPRVLDVARRIVVMVPRGDKAEICAAVLGDARDPRRWPGQLARRASAVWFLDGGAASLLPPGLAVSPGA
jgi:6-phosphogluconolactonase